MKNLLPRKSLTQNEDGAIFIIGIFAAMILCGCLFYAMGAMEAIQHREALQDTADGAAYTTASMQAKAMNLVSLLNIAKFSMAAILSTFSAIFTNLLYIPLTVADLPVLGQSYADYRAEAAPIIQSANLTQNALKNVLESGEISAQTLFGNSTVFTEHPVRQLPLAQTDRGDHIAQHCATVPSTLPGPPRIYDSTSPLLDNFFDNTLEGALLPPAAVPNYLALMRSTFNQGYLTCPNVMSSNNLHFQEINWTDVALEDFATHFYASKDTVPNEAESGVRIVLKDAPAANDWVERIRDHAGTVAWAQSYFFVDDTQPRETAMWRTDWQSSLGRFTLPNRVGIQTGCTRANGHKCASIAEMIESLEKASTH